MSVEDRYYKPNEFQKLSAVKRAGLLLKRKQRGGQSSRKDRHKDKAKKKGKQEHQSLNLSKRTIKALATAMRKEPDDNGSENASVSDGEEASKPPAKKLKKSTNRNNPALQRRS